MKNLSITTPGYKLLEKQFKEWLVLLNFEKSTVNQSPKKAREFFYWLEQQNITEIPGITKAVVYNYFEYLQHHRQNKKKGGKISKNYLRTYQQSLRRLARYLRE